jgi:hypothetical protein
MSRERIQQMRNAYRILAEKLQQNRTLGLAVDGRIILKLTLKKCDMVWTRY